MVGNRLSEANTLAHSLAVSGDLAIGGISEIHAIDSFPCKLASFCAGEPAQQQTVEDKIEASNAAREGIKLSAITHAAKEFFRLVGRDTHDSDVALRRADEAGHQVHEGGLAGAVGSNQTGDPGGQRQIYTIDAQHLAVEAGDVLKDDSARVVHLHVAHARVFHRPHIVHPRGVHPRSNHPRTTSLARRRLLSSRTASQQTMNMVAHASHTGTSADPRNLLSTPNIWAQVSITSKPRLNSLPQCTRNT